MATARCLSINFSSISSNCFSALRGFSLRGCFNLGDCFKSSGGGKLSKDKSESLSNSSHGDGSSDGGDNSPTSPTPILSGPGSFVMPIQDPENQKPEPITIKSVSVSVLQNGDLSNDPGEYIFQSLTTYNAPVSINNSNSNAMIIIPSVVVNSNVQALDDNYWVPINPLDHRKILVGGVDIQFQMPIPIIIEPIIQQTTPILANQPPKIDLEQKPIFEPTALNPALTKLVFVEDLQCLSTGVSTEDSDGSLSPIRPDSLSPMRPDFVMHNDPWGDELEPSPGETDRDILRIRSAFQGVDYNPYPSANNEGGGRGGYRRTPSNYLIHSNLDKRVAEEEDTYRTQPQFMTDEEHKEYKRK